MGEFKLTNAKGENPRLWVYEDIGGFFGGVTSADFRAALAEVDDAQEIDVHINSGGGDYFEGVAIHSNLVNRKGGVNVYVDGLAASAASIIAMAGRTIEMAAGAQLMIHEARAGLYGTKAEHEALGEVLGNSNADIVEIYMNRWKGSKKELVAAMDAETWYTADAAIAAGLADRKAKRESLAASVDLDKFRYRNTPSNFKAHLGLSDFSRRLLETFPELNDKEATNG